MMANCCRFCGLQSTLAPTSSMMVAVLAAVGNTVASAGRSTPGMTPRTILAVTMAAPVLPAVTKPLAVPSFTRRRPTRIEESRFCLTACAAFSSMVMNSEAWTTSMGKSAGFRVMSQFGAHHILLPHQKHSNVTLPCGKYRALYFRLGGTVRTHGIDRDGD